MRPSGTIHAPKRYSWDEADEIATRELICSACLVTSGGRKTPASHVISARCGCGTHTTAFCQSCTNYFAPVLEATCETCGQERRFTEPVPVHRGNIVTSPDPKQATPEPKEPDRSYLGEEADQWLA
jgi:hypothetical protein